MPSADLAPSEAPKSPLAGGIDWCFRDPRTGKLAVVQVPNLPLVLFILLSVVRRIFHPHGAAGAVIAIVAGAALIVWAFDEIVRGNSRFRRAVGAIVLIAFIASLVIN